MTGKMFSVVTPMFPICFFFDFMLFLLFSVNQLAKIVPNLPFDDDEMREYGMSSQMVLSWKKVTEVEKHEKTP